MWRIVCVLCLALVGCDVNPTGTTSRTCIDYPVGSDERSACQ